MNALIRRVGLFLAAAAVAGAAEPSRYFDPWHADDAVIAPDGLHLAYIRGGRRTEVVIVDCAHPATVAAVVLSPRSMRDTRDTSKQSTKDGAAGGSGGGGGGGGMGGGGKGSKGSMGGGGNNAAPVTRRPEDVPLKLQWAGVAEVQVQAHSGDWWSVTIAGKSTRMAHAPVLPTTPASPPPGPTSAQASADVQAILAGKFTERTVEITGWDDTRHRAIVLVSSPEDAGRFFLYDRELDRLTEFARRTPQLESTDLARVQKISATPPGAEAVNAVVAGPRLPTPRSLPLVILCRAPASPEASSGTALQFEPELHALVAAGFAVIEFTPTPAGGWSAASAALLQQVRYDSSRVAVMGIGAGVPLADQLAAHSPSKIRCIATIDAPFTLFHSESAPVFRVKTENGRFGPAFASVIDYLHETL